MPHKGAEGSKGHGLGDQKPQLEKRNHRQHTAAESSTDHTETQVTGLQSSEFREVTEIKPHLSPWRNWFHGVPLKEHICML